MKELIILVSLRSRLAQMMRYVHTLRYLKVKQLYYLVYRRFISKHIKIAGHNATANRILRHARWPSETSMRFDGNGFRFINHYVEWSLDDPQWDRPDQTMLWRYNLQYFDWLKDADISAGWKLQSVLRWISNYTMPRSPAWDPYPISLRLVNWIKFFNSNADLLNDSIREAIYRQAVYLKHNLELDIQANHLFKNSVALVFAGAFFSDDKGEELLKYGVTLLGQQIKEQFFPDGGHFERSPMYHSLTTEDLLDCVNLLKWNSFNSRFVDETLSIAECMVEPALQFLRTVELTDGKIALLNDSAWNNSKSYAELQDYYHRIIGSTPIVAEFTEDICKLYPDSKIFAHKRKRDSLLVDCGNATPSYQPGHAHAGIGSFEWVLNGERLVVDTGVFDYSNTEKRKHARSSRAHNTVIINGSEQSECWDNFRLARRALVFGHQIAGTAENFNLSFIVKSPLYPRQLKIKRTFSFRSPSIWTIVDEILHDGMSDYESRLHIAHSHRVVIKDNYAQIIRRKDNAHVATVQKSANLGWTLEESEWYPEFNKIERLDVIKLYSHAKITFRAEITLSNADGSFQFSNCL